MSRTVIADGLLGEVIPTLRAANRVYQARPAQPEQNLLDIVARQPFDLRNLPRCYRARSSGPTPREDAAR
jgi:hypothetical protein